MQQAQQLEANRILRTKITHDVMILGMPYECHWAKGGWGRCKLSSNSEWLKIFSLSKEEEQSDMRAGNFI
jgi:hypothetical protein